MTFWERIMLRLMPWYHPAHADERDRVAEAVTRRAAAARVHVERMK